MPLPVLETPTYELVLPSTNKKIKYRPFLVKEHKILLSLDKADDNEVSRVIKDLVDVCTFNKLKIDALPHFDVEYIFMQLRAKSIGENVAVSITCVNCNEKYDSSFNIENLKVEKKEGISNKIMLTDTVGIEMCYPRFDDVLQMYNSNDDSIVFDVVRNSIIAIYDQENYYETKLHTKEELDKFVNSLTKTQFKKIEEFLVNTPKIVQEVETECTNCKTKNISRIEGLQNFFV